MKQALQFRLSQSLALTPQLQQSIRLLQLSTLELNQELAEFMNQNPFLEGGDPADESSDSATAATAATTAADSGGTESLTPATDSSLDFADFGRVKQRSVDDDDERDALASVAMPETTLVDHLMSQLRMMRLSERDQRLAQLIIAHLNDAGYLADEWPNVLEIAAKEYEADEEDLMVSLRQVQMLDPAGVGARNLAECLDLQLSQLQRQGQRGDADIPPKSVISKARELVTQHILLLAARDFIKLKRVLCIDDEALRVVRDLIVSLDPKPGRRFGAGDTRYVTPDVFVRKVDGRWMALTNPDAVPRLRLNRLYADLISKSRDPNARGFSGQFAEAKWMLKNVQQRFDTILRVTQAIADRQTHFFEHGEEAMQPMVLREIAEIVGLHESTISRVTTQKFLLSPRGLFELKYFFGSHVATDTGGACSSTAIRALIKKLVGQEDGKKPLSDNRIADLLGEQGIVVARRTVAKYREALQIHPASQRKSI